MTNWPHSVHSRRSISLCWSHCRSGDPLPSGSLSFRANARCPETEDAPQHGLPQGWKNGSDSRLKALMHQKRRRLETTASPGCASQGGRPLLFLCGVSSKPWCPLVRPCTGHHGATWEADCFCTLLVKSASQAVAHDDRLASQRSLSALHQIQAIHAIPWGFSGIGLLGSTTLTAT